MEGEYQLVYTDAEGCVSAAAIYPLTLAPVDFSLGVDTVVCDTAYTLLIQGVFEELIWNTGTIDSSVTVTDSGTYGFSGITYRGCAVSDSVAVNILPPSVSVLSDTTLVEECGETRIRPDQSEYTLLDPTWSSVLDVYPDCLIPTVRAEAEGTLFFSAVAESGCPVRDSTYLKILRSYDVYLPNAFSPNGDGINDRFTAYTKSPEVVIEQFLVYDRWGSEVFSVEDVPVNDPAFGWSGQETGPEAGSQYVYALRLRFTDGRRKEFSGGVTLLR